MDDGRGRSRKVLILFTLIICVNFGNGQKKGMLSRFYEDNSAESGIIFRKDPSDVARDGDGNAIQQTSQVIRLKSSDKLQCPHSCFCEIEDLYALCVGDGQWNPPLLPKSMTRLELRNFYLPELEGSSIRLSGLQELQLQQCNLTRIHHDAFMMVPELDHLDLSQNLLENLQSNQLRGLSHLRHLDLSSNCLRELKRPFTYLTSLEHLNLRNNRLIQLDADTFDGLEKVQYVNLDKNLISIINVAAFQHLRSLAHLILSNNPLYNLARLNSFGARLQYIDVSNIGIKKVPQALTQFVRDLRLAKNKIREIHRGDLDSYPYIGLLVLDDNELQILEEDALGRHEYLTRIWLNGNKLQHVPQSLPLSLKVLYIERNMITTLVDGDFLGLINLEQIFMQRNHISSISKCTFCQLRNLKTIDLQANNITIISESIFANLYKLERLDLSQNPIIVLKSESLKGLSFIRILQISRIHTKATISEKLFEPLKSLQILEIYGSPRLVEAIINSSRLLHCLKGIRELNLMDNEISQLKKDFSSFFPKLSLIKLSGNSWDCSQKDKILWLKNWMQNSSINFYRPFSIRCNKPPSLGLKPVLLLEDDDFEGELSLESPSTPSPTFRLTRNPSIHLRFSLNSTKLLPASSKSVVTLKQDLPQATLSSISNEISYPPNILKRGTIVRENGGISSIPTKINLTSKYPTTFFSATQNMTNMDKSKLSFKPNMTSTKPQIIFSQSIPTSLIPRRKMQMEKNNYLIHQPTTKKSFLSEFQSVAKPSEQKNRTGQMFTARLPDNSSKMIDKWKQTLSNGDRRMSNLRGEISINRIESLDEFVSDQRGPGIHSFQDPDDAIIVGAGIISACLGITLIVGGYVLARRLSAWEDRQTSYRNWGEVDDGEYISERVVIGIENTEAGIETEGTVGVITESHHGLNNRLYFLLQGGSLTNDTAESLPVPIPSRTPNMISGTLCKNSRPYV